MYQKLRYIRGIQKTGISRLEVPRDSANFEYKQCTEWLTIDTPQEIESKLCECNQHHFGQAHSTFPTFPPFSEWIDWGTSSHTSELILEGTFSPPDVDALTTELLRHMKQRAVLDQIQVILTSTEWIGKISAWPESTSTSPSSFHLTHSKALKAKHDLSSDSPEYATLEEQWEQLIQWQVDLLNVAIKNQYSFHQWQSIVNVMILQQPGNHKIHHLRVIHLYEHEVALSYPSLRQHQKFNPVQYGRLPGHDAITPTIIEEIQYEISQASNKCPLVNLDYNTTACTIGSSTHGELNLSSPWSTPFYHLDQCDNSQVSAIFAQNTAGRLYH